MRKEADFEVTDKIKVTYVGTEKAETLLPTIEEVVNSAHENLN